MNADLKTILKTMLVSGVAGGSVASLAGLLNYLRANKLKQEGNTEWDDDTMYVYKKKASDNQLEKSAGGDFDGWTFGGQLVGAPLAFTGSYLLANWLINRKLRSDAQDELDDAQRVFIQQSGYEPLKKKAGIGSFVDNSLGVGASAALLLALSSAFATQQYVQANWPTKKPKVLAKPKKIKIVDAPVDDTPTEQEQIGQILDKAASDNSMTLAARMLCILDKEASVSSSIVHAVASGRVAEFEKAVDEVGFESAVDLIKGAAKQKVDDSMVQLAAQYCTKEASFSPQFKMAVAAEYQALHPEFCKEAAEQSEVGQLFLGAFASDAEQAIEHDLAMDLGAEVNSEKSAAAQDDVKQAYENLFKQAASPVLDNSDQQSTDISSTGVQSASSKSTEKIKQESQAYANAQVSPQDDVNTDPIDGTLSKLLQERKAAQPTDGKVSIEQNDYSTAPSTVMQTS